LARDLVEKDERSIVLSSPVSAIRQEYRGGVQVQAADLTVAARAVIVAIPPPLRAGIVFTPALPPVHSGFIQRSPMGSMSKVHAVYLDGAFWRDECFSGSAAGNLTRDPTDKAKTTGLTTCEFIADSSNCAGKPGILTSFIAGARNVALSGKSCKDVKDLVLQDFAYYFGEKALKPDYFVHFDWNKEKWTGGAFTSYLPPGVWTSYGAGWREPVGNIFWAGTETSDYWPGYYDGAVRAANLAACAISGREEKDCPRLKKSPDGWKDGKCS
jgi:monoamine oxidase